MKTRQSEYVADHRRWMCQMCRIEWTGQIVLIGIASGRGGKCGKQVEKNRDLNMPMMQKKTFPDGYT